ncbi:50S ribosomal protein L30 [bacterium]|nr:50S ribosomal protein L30 [bacterium]
MKKVKITQEKSAIGYKIDQKDTLKSLGLGKLHRTVVHNATPQIMGMIRKVTHLVKYEIIEEE